ncbi:MAG: MFS transporter, partial [Chloroflexota bacterium]|nr:MFS transporter [Chloroflexota bacterium]
GKSFGFHRALDSLGAVLGLLGAAAIVFLLQRGDLNLAQNTFQVLVLAAIGPAVLAVLLLLWLVKEKRPQERSADPSSTVSAPAGFSLRFKIFLGVMVLFTLGNSSDAFLILRAQSLGLSVLQILLFLVLFNMVYAALSGPAGVLSDRWGRKMVMIIGWTIYALIYLGFALVSSPWMVGGLFVLYGLYYGATEGVARAFVADMVGAERRGTAYGLFNTAVGITALPSSVIAGWLWQAIAPSAPFYLGAALAGLAMLALWLLVKEKDMRFDNRPQVG